MPRRSSVRLDPWTLQIHRQHLYYSSLVHPMPVAFSSVVTSILYNIQYDITATGLGSRLLYQTTISKAKNELINFFTRQIQHLWLFFCVCNSSYFKVLTKCPAEICLRRFSSVGIHSLLLWGCFILHA